MKLFKNYFTNKGLALYLRPYEIFVTSSSSGIIEYIPDTISIDALKKKFPKNQMWTMRTFFDKYFAEVSDFRKAQRNFAESLAGYSLFNYLFNIKDRHNGNILLDESGRLIHIDFGYML